MDAEPQFTDDELRAAWDVAEDFHSRVFLREQLPDSVPAVVFAAEAVRSSWAEMRATQLGDNAAETGDLLTRTLTLTREAAEGNAKRHADIAEKLDELQVRTDAHLRDVRLAQRVLKAAISEAPEVATLLEGVDLLISGRATDAVREALRAY